MTDRIQGFVVTLDRDLREDDAQQTIEAIRMIKGVLGVRLVVVEPSDHISRMRITRELRQRLWEALKDID